jgi:hypothetical protein
VGNERYDTVAPSGNGVGSEVDGGHSKSFSALAAVLGSDSVTFTSTSNAYCNAGSTTRDSLGNVVSCTVNGTTYSIATAGCANGGTLVYDTTGTVTGCTLNGIPQTVIGGGCNNAGLGPVRK